MIQQPEKSRSLSTFAEKHACASRCPHHTSINATSARCIALYISAVIIEQMSFQCYWTFTSVSAPFLTLMNFKGFCVVSCRLQVIMHLGYWFYLFHQYIKAAILTI
jgi:hypothetical protein